MERLPTTTLLVGAWRVERTTGQISRDGETVRLDVRAMRLLLCLADQAGEVVSIEDLLTQVWPGVNVSPDSVYQAVASLRRQLGDDPRQPTYIENVPRLGYRMVAAVSAVDEARATGPDNASPKTRRLGAIWAVAIGLAIVAAVLLVQGRLIQGRLFQSRIARNQPSTIGNQTIPEQNSVAVLPFLDLTEGMKEEEFADGMTEELIDKLSKIHGLRVPAPTASFYFKGKQASVAEIAKALGVTYVLDGSVRKSRDRVRIATRLVRADNGYVIWSETYDRPFGDLLWVQDDIASAVTKSLTASLTVQ